MHALWIDMSFWSFLLVNQSLLEADLEVEAKAVVGVSERVAGGVPRQLEHVVEFNTKAVVLDIPGARQ